MTRTIGPPDERMLGKLAGGLNLATALAAQQQQQITSNNGKVAISTGVLGQYPAVSGSPANYTYGWGLEVLSSGSGSAPVLRAGIIEWTSPSGGTKTIVGLVFCDASGLVRVTWTSTGEVEYDTTGAATTVLVSY